ncbi:MULTISPECIES: helix-turn-helix domain-containing protein [Burkholderia]|uniref:helix-turn-helix domain-containing protein n=1 Tax=Burkholderia TaxID=32008 RepID=UPI0009E0986C|nr:MULTISPECIES: helix-turn-helix domain-containing protein [Burkholderia]MBA9949123.1 helix-turn-helix domain-containing protein [Burkholderia cepacia]MBA9979488.1 helix-turn-helix domain-containing protein [Burkholderia cepacia]MBA9996285.1 helix-turn-helix domain-containing protein [Burkholderia cepacia]MBB0004227.1 helix-turn-helix domain-containing protein [Burkholderia cepacia]MBB0011877.1 helix-turn-helix domain-containing protein [Burkholderia cepacia]
MNRDVADGAPSAVSSWPQKVFCVPAADGEWNSLLSDIMQPGDLTIEGRAQRPGVATTARLLGGGVIADLRMPALKVVHRSEHVARSQEQEVLVNIVKDGAGELVQGSNRLLFRTGDVTFRNAHEPSSVEFSGSSVHLIAIRVPISRWQGYFAATLRSPVLAPRTHALTLAVNQLVLQMETGLADCQLAAVAALEQSFVLMLGAACLQFYAGTTGAAPRPEGVRWRQIHDYIDAHLYDATLAPAECARALRISERYLYRVLAQHGDRFSKILQRKRLDMSAERLRDPRYGRYQIASVAYQCGFKDPAHFSRIFSKRFGVSPREWRAYKDLTI